MDCEGNQKLVKKKSVKKHKISKRRKQNDSSGDEAVDLSEKIFPIVHYIDNREEMIKQVFSVMEKEKLNCMLPPILKGMTMSVLRENCLKELKNMSDDEVRKVLCGYCIEPSETKVIATLNTDSDSSSSVEICHNEEQEKRTLLDILEQEMQEIAYNTVLKRDEISPTQSDDGLPEVVAITPINSPSRTNNSVPLICIDSEDEEPATTAAPLNDIKVGVDKDTIVTKDKVTNGKNPTDVASIDVYDIEAGGSGSQRNYQSFNTTVTEACTKPKESFVIKVFSRKTSAAERVVKKVYKSRTSGKEVDKDVSDINKNDHILDSIATDRERSTGNETNSMYERDKQEVDQEVTIIEETEDVICLQENATSLCQSSSTQLDPPCDPPSTAKLIDTCIDLHDSNLSVNSKTDETIPEPPQVEEKEEGEITEEESEEDVAVLQEIQDEQPSPTVCLSSDASVIKSDSERPESRSKNRKHHHRHRRSKRSTESPERSKRRIEKRGNRIYRRKASSSVKDSLNNTEKELDIIEGNHSPSIIAQSEAVNIEASPIALIETPSAEPNTEESSNLELVIEEEIELGKVENVTSPNTLEIHISDTKLDSSEEAETSDVGEPVPTKTSWADRWAEKKDLKKVAITSKICRNVRKRILSARKKQATQETAAAQTPVLPPVPPLVLHVEGSVQEYQMLQLLVSDACDEKLSKGEDMKEDVNDKLCATLLESETCNNESQTNSTVTEPDQIPLPKSDSEEEITNKMEGSEV